MIKIYIEYSEFKAHSVFQGKRKLLKNLNVKSMFNAEKNFGANCFLRQAQSCSKILRMGKNTFNAVKIFRANCVFQAKRKLLKNPER